MLEENKANGTKRGTEKRAFNLFDIFVIALLLGGVALLVSGVRPFDFSGGDADSEKITLSFSVIIENVDQADSTAVGEGQEVFDADGVTLLGTVTGVTVGKHLEPVISGDACEMREIPGRADLTVTIRSESATYREGNGYLIGTVPVRVGAGMTMRFPSYYGIGRCDAFEAQPTGGIDG